ncbi:hypothetical protein DIPPA_02321 [Diplonema papillatum]|nr:hypothetical protein DIPPA_02321 [Diplonema papillatum]
MGSLEEIRKAIRAVLQEVGVELEGEAGLDAKAARHRAAAARGGGCRGEEAWRPAPPRRPADDAVAAAGGFAGAKPSLAVRNKRLVLTPRDPRPAEARRQLPAAAGLPAAVEEEEDEEEDGDGVCGSPGLEVPCQRARQKRWSCRTSNATSLSWGFFNGDDCAKAMCSVSEVAFPLTSTHRSSGASLPYQPERRAADGNRPSPAAGDLLGSWAGACNRLPQPPPAARPTVHKAAPRQTMRPKDMLLTFPSPAPKQPLYPPQVPAGAAAPEAAQEAGRPPRHLQAEHQPRASTAPERACREGGAKDGCRSPPRSGGGGGAAASRQRRARYPISLAGFTFADPEPPRAAGGGAASSAPSSPWNGERGSCGASLELFDGLRGLSIGRRPFHSDSESSQEPPKDAPSDENDSASADGRGDDRRFSSDGSSSVRKVRVMLPEAPRPPGKCVSASPAPEAIDGGLLNELLAACETDPPQHPAGPEKEPRRNVDQPGATAGAAAAPCTIQIVLTCPSASAGAAPPPPAEQLQPDAGAGAGSPGPGQAAADRVGAAEKGQAGGGDALADESPVVAPDRRRSSDRASTAPSEEMPPVEHDRRRSADRVGREAIAEDKPPIAHDRKRSADRASKEALSADHAGREALTEDKPRIAHDRKRSADRVSREAIAEDKPPIAHDRKRSADRASKEALSADCADREALTEDKPRITHGRKRSADRVSKDALSADRAGKEALTEDKPRITHGRKRSADRASSAPSENMPPIEHDRRRSADRASREALSADCANREAPTEAIAHDRRRSADRASRKLSTEAKHPTTASDRRRSTERANKEAPAEEKAAVPHDARQSPDRASKEAPTEEKVSIADDRRRSADCANEAPKEDTPPIALDRRLSADRASGESPTEGQPVSTSPPQKPRKEVVITSSPSREDLQSRVSARRCTSYTDGFLKTMEAFKSDTGRRESDEGNSVNSNTPSTESLGDKSSTPQDEPKHVRILLPPSDRKPSGELQSILSPVNKPASPADESRHVRILLPTTDHHPVHPAEQPLSPFTGSLAPHPPSRIVVPGAPDGEPKCLSPPMHGKGASPKDDGIEPPREKKEPTLPEETAAQPQEPSLVDMCSSPAWEAVQGGVQLVRQAHCERIEFDPAANAWSRKSVVCSISLVEDRSELALQGQARMSRVVLQYAERPLPGSSGHRSELPRDLPVTATVLYQPLPSAPPASTLFECCALEAFARPPVSVPPPAKPAYAAHGAKASQVPAKRPPTDYKPCPRHGKPPQPDPAPAKAQPAKPEEAAAAPVADEPPPGSEPDAPAPEAVESGRGEEDPICSNQGSPPAQPACSPAHAPAAQPKAPPPTPAAAPPAKASAFRELTEDQYRANVASYAVAADFGRAWNEAVPEAALQFTKPSLVFAPVPPAPGAPADAPAARQMYRIDLPCEDGGLPWFSEGQSDQAAASSADQGEDTVPFYGVPSASDDAGLHRLWKGDKKVRRGDPVGEGGIRIEEVMEAFSHFTFCKSSRALIVVVKRFYRDTVVDADVVLVANDKRANHLPFGRFQVAHFFRKHRCGRLCRHLNLPRVSLASLFTNGTL